MEVETLVVVGVVVGMEGAEQGAVGGGVGQTGQVALTVTVIVAVGGGRARTVARTENIVSNVDFG